MDKIKDSTQESTPEDLLRKALNTRLPADIVEAENTPGEWSVWRQGDDGNPFLVESGLPHEAAKQMVAELESHGHKQLYWCERSKAD